MTSEVFIFSDDSNRGGSQNAGLLAVQLHDMTGSPRIVIDLSHCTDFRLYNRWKHS